MNDSLREQCLLNKFLLYLMMIIQELIKDGIHLENLSTNILAGNFIDLLNKLIFSKSSEYS